MSTAAQIAAFTRTVADEQTIWLLEFVADRSLLTWENEDGSSVLPVWSSRSRAELSIKRIQEEVDEVTASAISLDRFKTEFVPKFGETALLLGPNWAGENLTGWSLTPEDLFHRIQDRMNKHDA